MILMSYVNIQEDTTNKLWYLDSGCNNHMSGDKKLFATLDETFIEKVKLGDNSSLCVKGRGNINIKKLRWVQTCFHCKQRPHMMIISASNLPLKRMQAGCGII
ncbi:unnamed protein product [Prunus armeniaca]